MSGLVGGGRSCTRATWADADMLPEYDFSKGVRGRYAGRFFVPHPRTGQRSSVLIRERLTR